MYISPQGTIQIFKNVPLTPQYEHTFYWDSYEQRETYLGSKLAYSFTNQMYTRKNNNKCRIERNAEDLYDACYMRFENAPFAGSQTIRWYYAFITNIEYINHNVTEITYQIDVIQTWFFAFKNNLGDCYIERQHQDVDNAGDNLVPEPFDIKEYISFDDYQFNTGGSLTYVVALACLTLTLDPTIITSNPLYIQYLMNGLYSGYKYICFDNPQHLQTFVNEVALSDGLIKGLFGIGDVWQIMGVFVYPTAFINRGASYTLSNIITGDMQAYLVNTSAFEANTASLSRPEIIGGINSDYGHIPRNKKLLTHPYQFISIHAPGVSNDYKYEYFANPNDFKFKIIGTVNPTPALNVSPVKYWARTNPYDLSISVGGFPYMNVYIPGILSTIGQNIGNLIKVAIMASASGGIGAESAQAPTTELTTYNDNPYTNPVYPMPKKITKTDADGDVKDEEIDVSHTSVPSLKSGSGITGEGHVDITPLLATGYWSLQAHYTSIRREYAERIDQFFSKYGYAINKVQKPNLRARVHWTYIKTRDCIVRGNIPQEGLVDISKIFDNGITFWYGGDAIGFSPRNIGDYSMFNYVNQPINQAVNYSTVGTLVAG